MAELSPAAEAVWAAFNEDEAGVFVDYGEKLGASLLALADQVLPEHVNPVGDEHDEARTLLRMRLRYRIRAIAAELGGEPTRDVELRQRFSDKALAAAAKQAGLCITKCWDIDLLLDPTAQADDEQWMTAAGLSPAERRRRLESVETMRTRARSALQSLRTFAQLVREGPHAG